MVNPSFLAALRQVADTEDGYLAVAMGKLLELDPSVRNRIARYLLMQIDDDDLTPALQFVRHLDDVEFEMYPSCLVFHNPDFAFLLRLAADIPPAVADWEANRAQIMEIEAPLRRMFLLTQKLPEHFLEGDLLHPEAVTWGELRLQLDDHLMEDHTSDVHRRRWYLSQFLQYLDDAGLERPGVISPLVISQLVAEGREPQSLYGSEVASLFKHLFHEIRHRCMPWLKGWVFHLEWNNKPDRSGWYVRCPPEWESTYVCYLGTRSKNKTTENLQTFFLLERTPTTFSPIPDQFKEMVPRDDKITDELLNGALPRVKELQGLLGPGVDLQVIDKERGWWPVLMISRPVTADMGLNDIIRFFVDILSLLINENVLGLIELMAIELAGNGSEKA